MKPTFSTLVISPLGILSVSLAFWLACTLSPFNSYTIRPDSGAVILLIGYLAAFIAGVLIPRSTKSTRPEIFSFNPRKLHVGFSVLLTVAAAGLLFKLFVMFFVDNFATYDSASAYRMAKLDDAREPSGLISQIATALFPLSLIAFVISIYLRNQLKHWQRFAAFAGFLGFAGLFVIEGGRTLLVTALIMVGVAFVFRGLLDPRLRVEGRKLVLFGTGAIAIALGFVSYSAYVIKDRLHAMGFDNPLDYLGIVEDDRDFHLEEPYRSMLQSDNPILVSGVMTVSSLTYYATHGFYEFSELYDSERGQPPLLGASEFHVPLRVLGEVGLRVPDSIEAMDRIPQPGLYYTAFGNVLIDYGAVGGLLYCLLLGAFVKYVWLKARQGFLLALLIYPYLASVIFHLPYLDMVSGGHGFFVACSAVFAVAILRLVGSVTARSQVHAVVMAPVEQPRTLQPTI